MIETVPGELLVVREGESAALSCEVKTERDIKRERKRHIEREKETQ